MLYYLLFLCAPPYPRLVPHLLPSSLSHTTLSMCRTSTFAISMTWISLHINRPLTRRLLCCSRIVWCSGGRLAWVNTRLQCRSERRFIIEVTRRMQQRCGRSGLTPDWRWLLFRPCPKSLLSLIVSLNVTSSRRHETYRCRRAGRRHNVLDTANDVSR